MLFSIKIYLGDNGHSDVDRIEYVLHRALLQ
jgi:hypothetical protein